MTWLYLLPALPMVWPVMAVWGRLPCCRPRYIDLRRPPQWVTVRQVPRVIPGTVIERKMIGR